MKPRTFYKLIVDGKLLQTYDHPVKAEYAAQYYFERKGVMPTIEAYKKVK